MSVNTKKIKIMIVDDELPIREWLQYVITSLKKPIEIIGVCKDGKEAIALYNNERPDVCITDIKMPNMNGVELLKSIKEIDHNAYVIMLTSHDDFELARQSLKFGASEYILKNEISSEVLATILDKYSMKKNRPLSAKFSFEDRYELKSCFLGESEGVNENTFNKQLNSDQFILTAHIKSNIDTSLFPNLAYKIEGVLSGHIYKYDETRFVFIVQLIHYSRHLEKYNAVLALAKEIEGICDSSIGAYEVADKKLLFSQALHMSFLTLGTSYYDDKPTCLYTIVKENSEESIKKLHLKRNEIIELINSMNFDKAVEKIDDYFIFLQAEKIVNIETVKQSLSDIIVSYKLYKLRFNSERLRIKASRYQNKIYHSTSIFEMKLIVQQFISQVFDVEQTMENQYSSYVNKAIAFIKEKYGTINQIKDVANYLDLNQEYLCRMFKAETGDTLNNYLTCQRILVACRLLKTTNLKVNEIAEIVGYNSLSYFSRAFSKKQNQSPHDYRINYYDGKEGVS